MAKDEDVPFNKKMRIVTREIHNVSDALINAKLGIAMSEDSVWAEGLLVFYEIFKYLEGAMERFSHTLIGDLDVPGMRRLEAFEKDLLYYLGSDWKKNYTPRESVVEYLNHLEKIENENPYFLTAYIYHLYMGLLSGGQILRRKKVLLQKLKFSRKDSTEGMAVTEVEGSVSSMKKQMTDAMNRIAAELDEDSRQRLLEESKMVFILNNKMVHTIQGAGAVVVIKVLKLGVYGIIVALLYKYIRRFAFG